MIGFAMCGSYCTHRRALAELEKLVKQGHEILPILSENVASTDTRFGSASDLKRRLFELTGREAISTVVDAEPLGPKIKLDALVICPCTGNTLAKMAQGITDTAVSMAAKAHLRSNRTLVIALASNDALSSNLKNISTMLNRKNVFFVPMEQDDPNGKPHSLVASFELLTPTLEAAMEGRQIQKIFI
ncbi:MAG: dipicolinate synthase subunit B [Clostridia bacterium]|nr:dipicolinate synthase subunit B [Clostridia bacterium]